jgi:hypothetical protein
MSPQEYGRQLAEQHMAKHPLTEEQAETAARILVAAEQKADAA